MKKEIFLGQIREILTILGSLCFATFEGWPAVTGLLVAIIAIVWAFIHHEDEQVIFTAIRKALSLAPGVLVYLGWIQEDQAGKLIAIVMPLMAMFWSWRSNGGTLPPPSIGLFIGLICLTLPSCKVLEGVDVDGRIYYIDKSGAKGGIDLVPGKKPAVWLKLPAFKKNSGGVHVDIKPVEIAPQK